jgi:protein-S-isoprenylcysteine O-methyltransferase Ste14
MNYLLVAIAVCSFLIYLRAIQKIFSNEHGISRRLRVLLVSSAICAFIQFWALAQTSTAVNNRSAVAVVFYVAGIATFFAAKSALHGYRLALAFSPDIPQILIERGIYSRVRHPFYTAYCLTWIAGVVATVSIPTAMTVFLMIGIYISAARFEERKFGNSSLATAYVAYRTRAGMLWPKI